MKKLFITPLLLLLLLLSSCSHGSYNRPDRYDSDYDAVYEERYEAARSYDEDDAWDKGYSDGHHDGYAEGYDDACEEIGGKIEDVVRYCDMDCECECGYELGSEEGYSEGYDDARYESLSGFHLWVTGDVYCIEAADEGSWLYHVFCYHCADSLAKDSFDYVWSFDDMEYINEWNSYRDESGDKKILPCPYCVGS